MNTWHLSASVLIPVFIHNVSRILGFVQCCVNGICGDCWGAGILAVTGCSDILFDSFHDRLFSDASELSLHCGGATCYAISSSPFIVNLQLNALISLG